MMVWVATLSLLVLHGAVRVLPAPVSATAAQPLSVVPSALKATLPVGATPLTVAVKVTLTPATDGLAELDNAVVLVVVGGLLTTCASAALVETVLFASPP